MTQPRKISLGWAIVHPTAEVPTRTGPAHTAKIYSTAGQARGAITQAFGKSRKDFYKVLELFAEVDA